jgi:hypothetical protein
MSEMTLTADFKTSTESGKCMAEQHGEGIENRNRTRDGQVNVNDRKMLQSAKQRAPIVST